MLTQKQMYYRAVQKAADGDRTFLFLVKQGMTRQELERLIIRRSSLWGRYKAWLPKLPTEKLPVIAPATP